MAVGLTLGACGAEEGAKTMSTETIEKTRPEVFNWPAEIQEAFTPVMPAGDWLNIEREPLLRLQVEAAPVVDATATVERAITAGQQYLPSSPGGCPAVIVETFGEKASQACAIAWCESRWNPGAVGDYGASLSYFQIQPRWHQWRVPGEDLADPVVNTRAAWLISSGGTDWSAWSCKWVVG